MSWFGPKFPNVKVKPELKALLEEQRRGHFDLMPKLIKRLAEPHLPVLIAKRNQLLYRDDYGTVVDQAWRRKMEYFLSNHVRLDYYTLDGRDPAQEKEFRLKFLDEVVSGAAAKCANSGVGQYDPSCSGVEFEIFVESVFQGAGAIVSRTPVTGDQGIDLIVEVAGRKIAVQCKRSSSPVGNSAV